MKPKVQKFQNPKVKSLSRSLLFLAAVLFIALRSEAQYSASNFTLVSLTDPETTFNPEGQKYSGCWGWYQASKNKEYAIVCSHKGTYWLDVTVPATPTVSAYRQGRHTGCTWREAKSYRNYLYVISDDFGNNSLQIFDMQYLPDSVHKVYDGVTLFARGHTLCIDHDKLYIGSATLGNTFSSMQVYSLANPANPALIRKLEQDYPAIDHVHDMLVRNDTVYASCGNQGLYIFQLMATNTFSLLGSLTNYPFSGYNHSSAITPNGQTLVFMDEVPSGLPIKVANVTNFGNIQVLATINQFTNTTPHNPFMVNNQYCFASSYQDGIQLFDISNPSAPVLAGYFDTHPQSGGNNNTWTSGDEYNGNWGAYPYLPSGHVLALDRLNGAFLLRTSFYQAPLVSADFYLQTSACVNTTINLVNASSGANTFTWTFPAGVVATSTLGGASLYFPTTGVYTVSMIAANPASGTASVTHTVTVINNSVTATVSNTNAACSTCSNGIAVITPAGGTSPYTYSWFPYGGLGATSKSLSPGCYTVTVSDNFGCKSFTSTCISFNSDVGIPSISSQRAPRIYPNPAQSSLTIDFPGSAYTYSIYNKLGQLISSSRNNQNAVTLSLADYPKGIYIVEIETAENRSSQKIIIE